MNVEEAGTALSCRFEHPRRDVDAVRFGHPGCQSFLHTADAATDLQSPAVWSQEIPALEEVHHFAGRPGEDLRISQRVGGYARHLAAAYGAVEESSVGGDH